MKRKRNKTHRTQRLGWTKAQSEAYTKSVKTLEPILGTPVHVTKCYDCGEPLDKKNVSDVLCPGCVSKRKLEVKDETIHSDVQS